MGGGTWRGAAKLRQLSEQLRLLHVDREVLGDAHDALVRAAPLAVEPLIDDAPKLDARAALMRDVLVRIAERAGRVRELRASPAPLDDELAAVQARCEELAGEASALRHALHAAQAQLSAAHAAHERLTEEVRAAYRQRDRAQSATVRAVEDPQGAAAAAANAASTEPVAAAAQPTEPHTDAGAVDAAAAAAAEEERCALRDLAQTRLNELSDLRAELLRVQQSLAATQQQLASVPDERVRAHPAYAEVHAEMVYLQQETERARAEAAALVAENESMREFRVEFQHQTTTQANTHCDELQKQLRARDADNARLRGQRDEINAELLERRARDSARPSQVDEVRAILGPKDERIAALTSQVRRLEQEVAAARAPVPEDAAAGDIASLQAAVAAARAQADASQASMAPLCDEVDRLSAAYDQLEKQLDARVTSAARLEDKLVRLTTEKAKADNKYFAAMRAKDAVDAEKRTLARSAERQAKVIERYGETERSLQAQQVQLEKEVSALRRGLQTHAAKLAEAERDRTALRRRHAEVERARGAAEAAVAQHLAAANEQAHERQRAEERAASLDREASRLRRRVAEGAAMPRKKMDNDTHLEYLNVRMQLVSLTPSHCCGAPRARSAIATESSSDACTPSASSVCRRAFRRGSASVRTAASRLP